jgi:acetyltransferase-like isoleucine patch superfamily enzyme
MNPLSKRYRQLTGDHGSWWVMKAHKLRLKVFNRYSTFLARIIGRIKGVEIGWKASFFGLPTFYRAPFSSIRIGNNCTFRSDHASNLIGVNHQCILSTHSKEAVISIGNDCGFSGVTIGAASGIRIGNNVLCGANVVITDFDWHEDISHTEPAPVIIHDNVWLGLNSVVLKGVTIGENSIIGANSLVVKDIPANVIAGGNPCKVLKEKTS